MDFKVKQGDEWVDASKIKFVGHNFVSDDHILENNRSNLELIDEWIKPCLVHDETAIIVSAGESVDFDELKTLMEENPKHKIFCVKHSFPKLIERGIIPWGLVILDTRPMMETSTLGKFRYDLIKHIDKRTRVFLLTRVHPSYTFFLQKKGIRVIGFHNHISEIAQSLKMTVEELEKPEHSDLLRDINESMITLPGSCAAICAINLAIFQGFRNIHLFGFDASVRKPEDSPLDKCHQVECNGGKYYVPNEFVSYGMEFQFIYNHYPKELNVNLIHHGLNTFLGALSVSLKPYQLVPFNSEGEVKIKSKKLNESIEKAVGGYFNHPIYDKDMVVRGYHSYEDYVKIQKMGNVNKISWLFANEECIHKLAHYLLDRWKTGGSEDVDNLGRFGICHGTRQGYEQKWFRDALNCEVIGTEISDTAKNYPHTIQMDFHDVKPEWIGAVDFIYSNSLDHSYDPIKCLDTWMSCLKKPHGVCILEWTETHDKTVATHLDPFGATQDGYKRMISKKYKLVDILEMGRHPLMIGERKSLDMERTFFIVGFQ